MVGILVFLLSAITFQAQAHPVTFTDGVMLKSMFREDMSENSITYTFHRKLAAGLEVDRLMLNGKDSTWGLGEFNILAQRWNGESTQTNIYLLSGAGGVWRENQSDVQGAGKLGLLMDHESREFYTAAQMSAWFSNDISTRYYVYKVGFAPFVAGYNDLNVWVVLQADYNKDMRKNIQVTPFLRFFYKNIFWEFGSSLRGNFYGQFMVHM